MSGHRLRATSNVDVHTPCLFIRQGAEVGAGSLSKPLPNKGVQATANSAGPLRSCLLAAPDTWR